MGKRKAEDAPALASNGTSKKSKHSILKDAPTESKPAKMSLMDDTEDSSSDDSDEDGGVKLEESGFKINEEYAKRFEYNKKREERRRLEEKYGKDLKHANVQYGENSDEYSDSASSSEEEDEEAVLATIDMDAQIQEALKAIKSRDPRRLDENVRFYDPIDEEGIGKESLEKKEKPMYLSDYHRENLLKGDIGKNGDSRPARSYLQEQSDLKRDIVKQIHEAADPVDSNESGDEDGFLIRKSKTQAESQVHPSKTKLDPTTADKDPETYLSNFMESRAWLPTEGARFQPLESDDDEDDAMAEAFEAAYNLRFEDPKGSNEVLKTYARDITAAKSVRRQEKSGRTKQRDEQRQKKEAEKLAREQERARLRKFRIEEAEEKVKKIKKNAGTYNMALTEENLAKILADDWDDKKWEEEMNKGFGDGYYAEKDPGAIGSDAEASGSAKKVKKPKWDDELDIKDLVPDFEDEDAPGKADLTLSGSEDDEDGDAAVARPKSSKDRKQKTKDRKRAARLEKKKIVEIVDNKIDLDLDILPRSSKKQPTRFQYRETSPTSFGLTAMDILMAPDAQLNQFAGLKKLASFRDPEKKKKDKKYLSKKARLREWRKETFGNEDGPVLAESKVNDEGGKKKSRREKSKKTKAEVVQ